MMNRLFAAAAVVAAIAAVALAAASGPARATYTAAKERTVPHAASLVANQFVADANRGDYAAVCRLYSRRYLKVSRAACYSLYQWEARIYGSFDYRIVRQRSLDSAHLRFDLIRWRQPSFIELARERSGWRVVAGGW